jgi:hypothetical protein
MTYRIKVFPFSTKEKALDIARFLSDLLNESVEIEEYNPNENN